MTGNAAIECILIDLSDNVQAPATSRQEHGRFAFYQDFYENARSVVAKCAFKNYFQFFWV